MKKLIGLAAAATLFVLAALAPSASAIDVKIVKSPKASPPGSSRTAPRR